MNDQHHDEGKTDQVYVEVDDDGKLVKSPESDVDFEENLTFDS